MARLYIQSRRVELHLGEQNTIVVKPAPTHSKFKTRHGTSETLKTLEDETATRTAL
ncbi:hypothetical protein [Coleofasciculus chthonoplastes]|uniref:hypothetical protein n=1 Tax=Coleofasciculus chthonoplastes TaxID=64178 RepID=UPI0033024A2C